MCYWQCEITELGLIPQHTFNIHHDIKVLIEHHKKWWLTDFVNIALAEPVCKQTQKKMEMHRELSFVWGYPCSPDKSSYDNISSDTWIRFLPFSASVMV